MVAIIHYCFKCEGHTNYSSCYPKNRKTNFKTYTTRSIFLAHIDRQQIPATKKAMAVTIGKIIGRLPFFYIVCYERTLLREQVQLQLISKILYNTIFLYGEVGYAVKNYLWFLQQQKKKTKTKNKQELSLKKDARRSTYIIFFYEQYFTEIT